MIPALSFVLFSLEKIIFASFKFIKDPTRNSHEALWRVAQLITVKI
jgi:hypothetical protein